MNWKWGILIAAPLVVFVASCGRQNSAIDTITAYGNCPKCGASVRGGLVKWDGMTTDGRPVSGADYKAECKSCNLPLFSEKAPDQKTGKINWHTIQPNKDSNKTPATR